MCVATDVAARGIDLPGLDLVIHADLPNNSETLLHRSGRTGRAGAKGISVLVAGFNQKGRAIRLLRDARLTPSGWMRRMLMPCAHATANAWASIRPSPAR